MVCTLIKQDLANRCFLISRATMDRIPVAQCVKSSAATKQHQELPPYDHKLKPRRTDPVASPMVELTSSTRPIPFGSPRTVMPSDYAFVTTNRPTTWSTATSWRGMCRAWRVYGVVDTNSYSDRMTCDERDLTFPPFDVS
jgi:hypothetical protein